MMLNALCSEQEDRSILKNKPSSTGLSIGVDAPGVFELFWSYCALAAIAEASVEAKARKLQGMSRSISTSALKRMRSFASQPPSEPASDYYKVSFDAKTISTHGQTIPSLS